MGETAWLPGETELEEIQEKRLPILHQISWPLLAISEKAKNDILSVCQRTGRKKKY